MKRQATRLFLCLIVLSAPTALMAQTPDAAPKAPAEMTPVPAPSASPSPGHTLEPPAFKPASPTPGNSPPPTPAPAPEAPVAAPAETEPAPPTTLREAVDGLSATELSEVLRLLKAAYVEPSKLKEEDLMRGTVQGVLDRLGPGATLLAVEEEADAESPFRGEILDDRIGYLRIGSLSQNNLSEMDAAISNFEKKQLHAAIIDLRATPPSSDFELATEVIKRFVPKGQMLFTIKKPSAKQERMFTSNQDPRFFGLIAVVVDADTKGAGEVIAAVLRKQKNALVIGDSTAGQGVEYEDLPLQSGKKVRVAVAVVALPDDSDPIFPNGVQPDIAVSVPEDVTERILEESLKSGISQFVFESERPRMNEASLVAGTNPDFDALQAAQEAGESGNEGGRLYDRTLQRAIDLLTTIAVYERAGR